MKNKLVDFKRSKYMPLLIFAFAISAFYLIFTRFIIKTDDGNFMAIAYSDSFNLSSFLKERYLHLSGRTVSELLLMLFIKNNILLWKLVSSAFVIYITWFWCKLSEFFSGEFSLKKRYAFCCTGFFLMIISCLNPSAFWFAGSFTYLWPFAGLVMFVSAPVFYLLSGKCNFVMCIASFFAAFLASSQEQSAVASVFIFSCIVLMLILKKQRIKPLLLLPLIPAVVCAYFLFTAPGVKNRGVIEAANGFERYNSMTLLDKLFCGVSVFFANTYYLSFFLTLILIALLALCVYECSNKKSIKAYLIFVIWFSLFVCVALNVFCSAFAKSLPHIVIRRSFITGELTAPFVLLVTFGALLSLVVASLVVILIINNKKVGISAGLLCVAAFGCALAMSFSSSIFQSGQRVFFFTNMFMFTACVILFSSLKSTKLSSCVYKCSLIYSSLMLIINCFAFKLFELPLMG